MMQYNAGIVIDHDAIYTAGIVIDHDEIYCWDCDRPMLKYTVRIVIHPCSNILLRL